MTVELVKYKYTVHQYDDENVGLFDKFTRCWRALSVCQRYGFDVHCISLSEKNILLEIYLYHWVYVSGYLLKRSPEWNNLCNTCEIIISLHSKFTMHLHIFFLCLEYNVFFALKTHLPLINYHEKNTKIICMPKIKIN